MFKKIVFLSFLFFVFIFLSNGIDEKLYKNLTQRDRILLAISYYEVGKKYEVLGKKELAKSYLNEAFKIEKDVEKYVNGQLEIPPKTIKIDWEKIFEEESKQNSEENMKIKEDNDTTDKNTKNKKENYSLSEEEFIKKLIEDFFTYINNYDSFNVSNLFTEEVLVESADVYVTKKEIKDSFEGFFSANYNKKYKFDTISIDKVSNDSFKVNIKLIKGDNFFIFPLENDYLKLGVTKSYDRYLFNKIFGILKEKDEQRSENIETNDNLPEDILKAFIYYVIKKEYSKASFFFLRMYGLTNLRLS